MASNATVSKAKSVIGTIDGKFAVDQNGSATYTILLKLPPGTDGVQPQLTLTYNSAQGNGWLGVGWDISGLSTIQRVGTTIAQDGVAGNVDYDLNDRYALDDQRLILVKGGEYGKDGTVYHTEIESWKKITGQKNAGDGVKYFEVRHKDGSVLTYGSTDDSRIHGKDKDEVRVWAIDKIVGPTGNFITFAYTNRDSKDGAYYPLRVDYTGNDQANMKPRRSIQFIFEDRDDVLRSYIGGKEVKIDKRLKRIETFVDKKIVKSYHFSYEKGDSTKRSRLKTIAECDAKNDCLTETKFKWQNKDDSFTEEDDWGSKKHSVAHKGTAQWMADVNGDGMADHIYEKDDSSKYYVMISKGDKFDEDTSWGEKKHSIEHSGQDQWMVDMNGDGMADHVYNRDDTNEYRVRLSNGKEFKDDDDWGKRDHKVGDRGLAQWFVDVTGDQLPDAVYRHQDTSHFHVLVNHETKLGDDDKWGERKHSVDHDDTAQWMADVNGDGMADYVYERDGDDEYRVMLSKGDEFADDTSWGKKDHSIENSGQSQWILDMNGDGLADHIYNRKDKKEYLVRLSTGKEFKDDDDWGSRDHSIGDKGAAQWFVDLNSDGFPDHVYRREDTSDYYVRLNTGSSFRDDRKWGKKKHSIAHDDQSEWLVDLDGDGMADHVYERDKSDEYRVRLSKGSVPDLVFEITDGVGGQDKITYRSMSDPNVYESIDKASSLFSDARTFVFTQTQQKDFLQNIIGGTKQIVSSYKLRNDSDRNNSKYEYNYNYTYVGALFDHDGRGSLGFSAVKTEDHQFGNEKVVFYNPVFPFTGTVRKTEMYCSSKSEDSKCKSDFLLDRKSNAYLCEDQDSCSQSDKKKFRPLGSDVGVYQVLKQATQQDIFSYGNYQFSLGKTFNYDRFGNIKRLADLGRVDKDGKDKASKDNLYTILEYANDDSDRWFMGYQTLNKKTTDADGRNILQQTRINYDFSKKPDHTKCPTDWKYQGTIKVICQEEWVNTDNSGGKNYWLQTKFDYDNFGNRTKITGPAGDVSHIAYDNTYHTFPTKKTFPKNQQGQTLSVTYLYDPFFGVELANTDANGQTLAQCIDGFGRLTEKFGPIPKGEKATPDANCPALKKVDDQLVILEKHQWQFDSKTQEIFYEVEQRHDWNGKSWHTMKRYFDGLSRTHKTISDGTKSDESLIVNISYVSPSVITRTSLPYFKSKDDVAYITKSFNSYGRLIQRTQPYQDNIKDGLTKTTWEYKDGNVIIQTDGAGTKDAQVTQSTANYIGSQFRVAHLIYPDGGKTTFEYDSLGRTIKSTDPVGVTNRTSYNSLNQTLTTNGTNTGKVTFFYNKIGQLSSQIDAKGQKRNYRYDLLNRLLTKTLLNQNGTTQRVVQFTYDNKSSQFTNTQGRSSSITIMRGNTLESKYQYGYDPYGQLNKQTVMIDGAPQSYTIQSHYDPLQRELQFIFPDGSQSTTTYSNQGYVQNLSLNDPTLKKTVSVSYSSYNAFSLPKQILYGNSVEASYDYYRDGMLKDTTLKEGKNKTLLSHTLTWNRLKDITKITDTNFQNLGKGVDHTQGFTYKNRRLKEAKAPGTYGTLNYQYDQAGNITLNQGILYTYSGHQISTGKKKKQTVFTARYDKNGNMVSKQNNKKWAYSYDTEDRLSSVSESGTVIGSFLYDYRGTRVKKTNTDKATTFYISPEYEVTVRPDNTIKTTKYLSTSKERIAAITTQGQSGQALYFHQNHVNSTDFATDEGGNVISSIVYQPYGAIDRKHSSGLGKVRHKFGEKELDRGGLYYFSARYYDPVIARFITADDRLGGSLTQQDAFNRYAFVLNNPVTYTDPSGHSIFGWVDDHVVKPSEHFVSKAAKSTLSFVKEHQQALMITAAVVLTVADVASVALDVVTGGATTELTVGLTDVDAEVIGDVVAAETADAVAEGVGEATAEATAEGTSEAAADTAEETVSESTEETASSSSTEESTEASEEAEESDSCGCFIAGTVVSTQNGFKPIEEVKPGDLVWSYNEKTGENELKKVTQSFERTINTLVYLTVNGEMITTTMEHPFRINKNWVHAKDLKVGDQPMALEKDKLNINGISTKRGMFTVYNFEVETTHNYYIGQSQVLVHNTSCNIMQKLRNRELTGQGGPDSVDAAELIQNRLLNDDEFMGRFNSVMTELRNTTPVVQPNTLAETSIIDLLDGGFFDPPE